LKSNPKIESEKMTPATLARCRRIAQQLPAGTPEYEADAAAIRELADECERLQSYRTVKIPKEVLNACQVMHDLVAGRGFIRSDKSAAAWKIICERLDADLADIKRLRDAACDGTGRGTP